VHWNGLALPPARVMRLADLVRPPDQPLAGIGVTGGEVRGAEPAGVGHDHGLAAIRLLEDGHRLVHVARLHAGAVPTDSVGGLPFDRPFRHLSIMEALQQETDTLRRMSPEQKLTVMHALIRQAWELKAAVIRAQQPELSETEVRARAWELVGGDRP
jgi:hypothetical protein